MTRFESSKEWENPESFVHDVSTALASARTVHHGHMPEISFTGPDTARRIWAMYDFVEQPEAKDGQHGIVGYGPYEEECRRTDKGWKISFLRLTRLGVDVLTGEYPQRHPITRTHSPTWL